MLKVLLLIGFIIGNLYASNLPQSYYQIQGIEKKKDFFFNYLYELIEQENINILKERNHVLSLFKKDLRDKKNRSYKNKLLKIKWKYDIKKLYDKEEYLKKIDVVPASLALAQAAVESDLGRSRFTKEAHNIFGHWTYDEKIGIIPKKRPKNAKYFIRVFGSLQEAVTAYMLNLNRNKAFKSFQDKRDNLKQHGKSLSGLELSQTLINYSGIGTKYLDILKTMIKNENLEKYDRILFYKIKG